MNIINLIDSTTLSIIKAVSPKSDLFASFVYHLSTNELLKGGVLSSAIWWIWFKKDTSSEEKKSHISLINTLFASVIAVAAARIFALYLPYRARPVMNNPESWPFPDLASAVDTMSSFPSDHATLSICLATGIYTCSSKRLGVFIVSYSIICILIPRIYLGLHFASDIFAGAIVGMMTILLINNLKRLQPISAYIYSLSEKYPQTFYAILFIFTYQTSDLYIHLRHIARFMINVLS